MGRTLRLSRVGWAIVIFIFAAVLLSVGLLKPAQRFVAPVLTPIGRVSYSIVEWWKGIFAERSARATLEAENATLRQRLTDVELERTALDKQLAELKLLRQESDFLNRRSLKGVAGRVVGRAQTSAQVLLVDVGSQEGIRTGAPVIANEGILIGVVTAVAPATTEVRLLTAEGTDIAVRVERQDGPSGVLVGERGVGMQLTLVPKGETIAERQLVMTADVDPRIPSNLLIGSIATLEEVPGALFQNASVIPSLAYDQLSVVTILQ